MRRRHKCGLCAGHGKRVPVGNCHDCNTAFCDRHGTWVTDRWLCAKCARQER